MSVRVGERSEGKLQVLNDIRLLAEYTLRICKSDKVFPKSSRWIMANRLVNECLDAYGCVRRANATPLDEINITYRNRQQTECKAHLEALLGFIDLAYTVFHIDENKIQHWVKLTNNVEKKLAGWEKSDKERINGTHK